MNLHHKFLHDLARFVPAFSQEQLLRAYFDGNRQAFFRALHAAESQGLISVSSELVRARDTSSPIAIVRPGGPSPWPGRVAYLASRRWGEFNPTLVIRATGKLCICCGGNPVAVASGHLSHEVALADVFLNKRQAEPEFEWTLQTQGGPRGCRVDAISASSAVELVGQYSSKGVASKIGISGNLTLELW